MESTIQSITDGELRSLFPVIAHFWDKLDAIEGYKIDVREIKKDLVCWQCPKCQWMRTPSEPSNTMLRGYCTMQHVLTWPIFKGGQSGNQQEVARIFMHDCSTFSQAIYNQKAIIRAQIAKALDKVLEQHNLGDKTKENETSASEITIDEILTEMESSTWDEL